MTVIDLNVLLYVVNESCPQHGAVCRWWEDRVNGPELVGLPWVTVLGFMRITTGRAFPAPLTMEEALVFVEEWLALPAVRVVSPGEHHWRTLSDLVRETGTKGTLTTDAHLAALAIERGATLASCDADFARFPRLRWVNPLHSSK